MRTINGPIVKRWYLSTFKICCGNIFSLPKNCRKICTSIQQENIYLTALLYTTFFFLSATSFLARLEKKLYFSVADNYSILFFLYANSFELSCLIHQLLQRHNFLDFFSVSHRGGCTPLAKITDERPANAVSILRCVFSCRKYSFVWFLYFFFALSSIILRQL